MAKITKTLNGFFLRTSKKEGVAPLYLTIKKSGVCLTLSSGINVDIKNWTYAIQKTQRWNEYSNTEEGKRVSDLMDKVNAGVDELVRNGVSDGEAYRNLFQGIVSYKEHLENEKACIDNLDHIVAFYEYFIDGIESGLFTHHGDRPYKTNTIKHWKEFRPIITSFCNQYDTFNDIDRLYAARFNQFLENRGYMKQTANIHIGMMRKLCNHAYEFGKNENPESLNVWKRHSVEKKDIKTSIYLTEEELDALYEMKLSGRDEIVRDIFFLGYLSWQRWGDYSKFNRSNFKTNQSGIPVIALTQEKTGNYVEIPIVDARIDSICKKYNYKFPTVTKGEAERRLRKIMMQLSKQVQSLNEKFVTNISIQERKSEQNFHRLTIKKKKGEKLIEKERIAYYRLKSYCFDADNGLLFERDENGNILKPKYMMVSTHTSRRSSITNGYKSGVFDSRELMSMSGHSTEKIMLDYIKIGTSEQAKRVYEKMKKMQEEKQQKNAKVYRMAQ